MVSGLTILGEPNPAALLAASNLSAGLWEFSLRICDLRLLRRSIRRAGKAVSETIEQYEADETFETTQVAFAQAEQSVKRIEAKAQVYSQNLCGDMVIEYAGANVAILSNYPLRLPRWSSPPCCLPSRCPR